VSYNAAGESDPSNEVSITTPAGVLLQVPVLKSPADGFVVSGLYPRLEWYPVAGAEEYLVVPTEGSPMGPRVMAVNVRGVHYDVRFRLNWNTTHYWSITAQVCI
jgi:hypothetical protein